MKKIRIALAQIEPISIKDSDSIESLFSLAKKRKADLICFPEQFLQKGVEKKNYDHSLIFYAKTMFSHLSKKYSLYCVMGSVVQKVGKKFYNRSYFFNNRGKILGFYDKIHIDGSEKWKSCGKKTRVFDTALGKIGMIICRDLLYPAVSQELAKKSCEIILCPAAWCSYCKRYPKEYLKHFNKKVQPSEIDSLIPARAIENGIAFLFCNAAGSEKDRILLGRSQAAIPFYGTIKKLNHNREEVLFVDVNLSLLRSAKKAYGFQKN